MGVHNEKDEHLRVALDSICDQTYKDIEFIIVDDGSNEHCRQILAEYESKWSFIHVIHNKTNLGLTKSLNIGLHNASGAFIARMDADDYSVQDRIQKQVIFLNENEEIDLCGTGVVSFGSHEAFLSPPRGLSNDEAQCLLFFSSTLCHPSVMIRKAFLENNQLEYDETISKGQDYDMWERCSASGKLAVMKEVLLFYRTHSSQITSTHKEEQESSADRTRLRRLHRLGITPSEDDYKCHKLLASGKDRSISVNEVKTWANKLITANDSRQLVCPCVFKKDLHDRLVLYKLRNGLYAKLFNPSDLLAIVRLAISRLSMHVNLRRETRKLHSLLSHV